MSASNRPTPQSDDRHGLAIDELTRSIDHFRQSLAQLRPSLLADTGAKSTETRARRLYSTRRRRAAAFPDHVDLFSEPAWDMLLDLFIAGESERQISTTDAATGACVSTTSVHRWIATLEERGLIERYADRQDRRRSLVRLTPAATIAMRAYLDGL